MTKRTPEVSVRDLPYTNPVLIKYQSENGKFLRLTVLPLLWLISSSTVHIDLYHSKDISYKAWPDTKTKHTTGKSKPKLVSGPIVRLIHQSIAKRHQFEIVVFIRFSIANGQGLPLRHTEPNEKWNFENDGASRYFGGWLWELVHLLILFCLACWMFVFDQTLVEHLSYDKGLLLSCLCSLLFVSRLWSFYEK